jgi:group I intron endonuclease
MNYLETSSTPGIYAIVNKENGKLYVGSAVSVYHRLVTHVHRLRKGIHSNPILQAAWKKWGESSFDFEILESFDDKFWLLPREQRWLDTLEPWKRDSGYNILSTAESRQGHETSEATRKKLSLANKGRKFPPSFGQAISKALKGKKYKPCSDERKEKMRAFWATRILTESERKALSDRVSGNKNPFFGKHHSPETLERIASHFRGHRYSEERRKAHALTALHGENHPMFGRHHLPESLSLISQGGKDGAHRRWHIGRGIVSNDCELCLKSRLAPSGSLSR